MAAKPFHLAWFLQGSSAQAWGEAVDRPYRHDLDGARAVPQHGAHAGARLLRLHPARRFVLCRRELRRFDRDLPQERHRRAAPGSVGGGGADDPGDVAHRHRADLRHLRLSPLPAGAPGGDARPGVGRAHRLERRHRQLRLCGHEFRHAGHARARPALRHGRRIHGSRAAACGARGSRARSIADRKYGVLVDPTKVHAVNYQGKYFSTRGPLNSGPGAAGPAGDRPGRRLAARPQVRRRPRRHHRRARQGHRGDEAPIARTCTSTWSRKAASRRTARCCS